MRIYLLLMISSTLLFAQNLRPPNEGGFTTSLGQPPVYKMYAGFSAGSYRPADPDLRALTVQLRLGVFKDLTSPVVSALGWTAEGYFGDRNALVDGGLRALLEMPIFRIGGGVDYNIRDNRADFMLRLTVPLRRSGVFGNGTGFRLEWLPARDHSFNIGVHVPIFQPNKGETRARSDHVQMSKPTLTPPPVSTPHPTITEALENVRQSAHWINRLTTPYFDHAGGDPYKAIGKEIQEIKAHLNAASPLFPGGRTSEAEVRMYHRELERAFSVAVSGKPLQLGESIPEGREVAFQARQIILDQVIIPYDRLLGQIKKKDTILGLAVFARGSLARWLHISSTVPEDRVDAVRYVFQQLIDIIEENREYSHKVWKDSRLVWIPFQYALLPEQHDKQEELDALIERAVGEKFTDGNRVWYIINEQFQYEVARQIHQAEDYHILWIHDFKAKNAAGNLDSLSFAQVLHSYFGAMIKKVRAYDDTGKFPVYMIVIDQHYYELSNSRKWFRLLEEPLDITIRLSNKVMEDSLRNAQARLRKAVRESELLQAEAMQYGQDWLKNLIKVHINVTNPADMSFWSRQILPIVGVPDNLMRDHRKISFYDISEEHPYKGMAMHSGMGIGEHYVGPTWEDRGIMVQGPAALELKETARQLLLNQGFKEDEIPYPLRVKSKPPGYDQIVQDTIRAWIKRNSGSARAMELHNQTGYHPKSINVIKAMLYTLMPAGSILKIPDSLWNGFFLAAQLVGNALRGGKVFIIAPSLECAPSSGFPQMSRAQELFARLIVIQDILSEEIAAVDGMLKTGMYDPEVDVADMPGKVKSFRETLRTTPFLEELYGFHPSVYAVMDSVDEILGDFRVKYLATDAMIRRPTLHLKANFFASGEGWKELMIRPEFADVFRFYIVQQALQIQDRKIDHNVIDEADDFRKIERKWVLPYVESLSAEERQKIIYYLLVGSANQDYRSMMMDGEAMVAVSSWQSLLGLMDFIFMMGQCKWVDDLEKLEKYLPAYNGLQRKIGRWIKTAL